MASLSLWVHPRFALHLGKDNSFHFLPLPSLSSTKWLKIIICIQHLIVIWSLISSLVVVFLWWAHGVLSCSLTSLNCTLPHEWIWVKAEHPRKMLAGLTHLLLRGFFFSFLCSVAPCLSKENQYVFKPVFSSLGSKASQVQQSFWGLAFVFWQKKGEWFLKRFWALDKKERDSLQLQWSGRIEIGGLLFFTPHLHTDWCTYCFAKAPRHSNVQQMQRNKLVLEKAAFKVVQKLQTNIHRLFT